jgi:hypothetical protein
MGSLEFREVPQLEERIRLASGNHELELDPNCYGTAFFLFGVLPYEVVIFTHQGHRRIKEAVSRMHPLDSPQDNSLIISSDRFGNPLHAAFLEAASPFKGYHRMGSQGPFREFTKIQDIEEYLIACCRHPLDTGPHVYNHQFYALNKSDNLSDWAEERVGEYSPGWRW